MNKKNKRAYSLIELMVTLVILAGVLSMALISMRGYLPKQRLLGSIGELENFLQRAQAEASARSYWTCVNFDTSTDPVTAILWADMGSTHGDNPSCGADPNAVRIATTQLKRDVIIVPQGNSGCSKSIGNDCIIWFDSTGLPKKCQYSGSCGDTTPTTCVDDSYQIVLSNPNLEAGVRARELEAISGGLIQSVKLGEKGLVTSAYAKGKTLTDGCE